MPLQRHRHVIHSSYTNRATPGLKHAALTSTHELKECFKSGGCLNPVRSLVAVASLALLPTEKVLHAFYL